MTSDEAARMLLRASGVDGRKAGELQARMWGHLLRDVDYDDAMAAVDEHYTTSDKWLMPVHVINGAAAIANRREGARRRQELDAQIAAENGGSLPGDSPRELSGPPADSVASVMVLAKRVPPSFSGKRPADVLREAVAEYTREQIANAERDDPELAAQIRQARAEARAELDALRRRDEPRENAHV